MEAKASGILIVHTPAQLDAASSLVDLLEASLTLSQGAIACSSLPGYAWRTRAPQGEVGVQFGAVLDSIGAAIGIVDESALRDPSFFFDLAAVWAQKKRVAVLIESPELRALLPAQLERAEVFERADRAAVVALVEDLAFDLNLTPRIGEDARRALVQLSTFPPPPGNAGAKPKTPAAAATYEALDEGSSGNARDTMDDEIVVMTDADEPTRNSAVRGDLSCALAFEAGRGAGESAFHRDEPGYDPLSEIEDAFGRFVDAIGGQWADLVHAADVQLWLSTVDDLIRELPPQRERPAQWYELGFQFATLQNIAASGPPDEPNARIAYLDLWGESMTQLRQAAMMARVAPREVRRLQSMLENLIGPESDRDYTNVARSREHLLSVAQHADNAPPAASSTLP